MDTSRRVFEVGVQLTVCTSRDALGQMSRAAGRGNRLQIGCFSLKVYQPIFYDCLDRYISFLIKARFLSICFNMYPTLVELAVNEGRLLIVHLIERGRK